MVVYHGSDSNFKKLRIAKDLVKRISTKDNEGMGIYFSTDKEVARSYGKYIYTLEITDEHFLDFREFSKCLDYVCEIAKSIREAYGVDIFKYFDGHYFARRMFWGGQALFKVGSDIAEILDNTEPFYCSFPKTTRDKVYNYLKRYDKQLKSYMFNYHIKNIGVIKDVGDSVVKIVCKESSH